MRVFLSFSGEASQQVAMALHDWIRRVLQGVKPWMSQRDIAAGNMWMETLSTQLRGTEFVVICLTPENKDTPWLHFEAGAVWRNVTAAHVCPYLFNLTPEALTGALREFQSLIADREGTFRLLQAINSHPSLESPLDASDLQESFEVWWPRLEKHLLALRGRAAAVTVQRPVSEIVTETLDLVRKLTFDRFGRHAAETETLTVDLQPVVGKSGPIWTAPFSSFKCVSDLLDEVYFKLEGAVEPFTYDKVWVLMNPATGKVFRDLGSKWSEPRGMYRDGRTLWEVGFSPGIKLEALLMTDPRVKILDDKVG